MPDIVILPSAKETEELRRLLIEYRQDKVADYEIEEFMTILVSKTFRLAKSITRFIEKD